MNVTHAVHEPRGLLRDGRGNAWIAVSHVRDPKGCSEIQVPISVGIGDGRALGGIPKHRKVVEERSNVLRFEFPKHGFEAARRRAGNRIPNALEIAAAHVSSLIQRTNSAMRGRPPW